MPAAGEEPHSDPEIETYYYKHCLSVDGSIPYERSRHWLDFFGLIADRIRADIQPRTVLDAGCAMGFLVEALRDRGIEAYGVDISDYAIAQVREDIRPHCWVGSVAEPFPQRYDLIVCLETLEHLPPGESERAVDNFCAHTDDVLFSSSPLDLAEVTHHNARPPEYWAQLFARHGLFRDVDYDPGAFIAPWAVRWRKQADPVGRILSGYERALWWLRNENYAQRQANLEQRDRLAALESERDRLLQELRELQPAGQRAAQLEVELSAMKQTLIWRAAQRLRLSPPGRVATRLLHRSRG